MVVAWPACTDLRREGECKNLGIRGERKEETLFFSPPEVIQKRYVTRKTTPWSRILSCYLMKCACVMLCRSFDAAKEPWFVGCMCGVVTCVMN